MFEITTMTFVSLIVLCILAIKLIIFLFSALGEHDHITDSTLNKPLKNRNKPWYNKQGKGGPGPC